MLGGFGDLPLTLGGGPTPSEQAYGQLRHAVGVGGSAPDDTGIDGLWRRSKALGLAAGASHEPRALLQAFPQNATDLLPYYERLFQVVPPTGATESQRRAVVTQRFYESAPVGTSEYDQQLKAIDSRLAVYDVPAAAATETVLGVRAFEARNVADEGPDFNYPGGAKHTDWPNFNTHQRVHVRFTLGYPGGPTEADRKVLARAKVRLRLILPSDTDFTIAVGPWVLGITPIGLGAVG